MKESLLMEYVTKSDGIVSSTGQCVLIGKEQITKFVNLVTEKILKENIRYLENEIPNLNVVYDDGMNYAAYMLNKRLLELND